MSPGIPKKYFYALLIIASTTSMLVSLYKLNQSNKIEEYSSQNPFNLFPKGDKIHSDDETPVTAENKMILLYSYLWNERTWFGLKEGQELNCFNKDIIGSCYISYNNSQLSKAAAVVFHSRSNGFTDAATMPRVSTSDEKDDQLWVYYTLESPVHNPDPKPYNGVFDVTATYQLNSDIVTPYGGYRELLDSDPRPPADVNYFRNKTKMVLWVVSNCGKWEREETVRLLEANGVEVDAAGGCKGRLPDTAPNINGDWKSLGYKFYLSAENSFCEDYITEKYWRNALLGEMIPIVMGGGNYSNPKLAIPGSFINVHDFETIADLAKHIITISSNEELYNSYFQWKQKYVTAPSDKRAMLICGLCGMIHNTTFHHKTRTPVDLEKFYGRGMKCGGDVAVRYGDVLRRSREEVDNQG